MSDLALESGWLNALPFSCHYESQLFLNRVILLPLSLVCLPLSRKTSSAPFISEPGNIARRRAQPDTASWQPAAVLLLLLPFFSAPWTAGIFFRDSEEGQLTGKMGSWALETPAPESCLLFLRASSYELVLCRANRML